jgi:hypothetical protein
MRSWVVTFVFVALVLPSPAGAAVRLGGPLVALGASPGAADAVVGTSSRNLPFRLVRSGGRSATPLAAFGSLNAEFADVSGSEAVFARPTSTGFSYETADGTVLAQGTGPPVLTPDGQLAYPDADGDVVLGDVTLTATGPVLHHAPLDATDGAVLDLVQSRTRTELRVVGPKAPSEALTSLRGFHTIPATITSQGDTVYVAYRVNQRVTLATARAGGRWQRRRVKTRGSLNGAPAVIRAKGRTLVATSQRIGKRRGIFVGARRLTNTRFSDLDPLAATGPDGRAYVGWTRQDGPRKRSGLLARVL